MWHAITQPTGIVETVLWGVVGREPAREGTVDAFRDCIVPILQKKKYCQAHKSHPTHKLT
jgi:hypothetical protein